MARKKQIERICANCKLFNPQKGECSVVILHEGERYHLPVEPKDSCFFEDTYFDPTTKAMEDFVSDIKEVKFWVENEKGQKTGGDGVVKMEYPEGFFGAKNSKKFKRPATQQAEDPTPLDEKVKSDCWKTRWEHHLVNGIEEEEFDVDEFFRTPPDASSS